MYCPKCGAQNDDQAAFCNKCGTILQKAGPTAGAAASSYTTAVQYAGFWRRFAASLIDFLIYVAVSFLIDFVFGISPISRDWNGSIDTPREVIRYFGANALTVVLVWLYFALMESSMYQATLGKMALGIAVTDMHGRRVSFARATGRHFGKLISSVILCIGHVMIAFTAKKQALHDIMADCLVVVKKKQMEDSTISREG